MAQTRTRTVNLAAVSRLLVLFVFVLAQLKQEAGSPLTPRGLLVAGFTLLIAGVLVVAPGDLRKGFPHSLRGVPVMSVVVVVASLFLLVISRESSPALAALMFGVGSAAVQHPLSRSLPVGLLALAGLLLAGLTGHRWDEWFGLGVSTCLVFLFAYAIRLRREARSAEAREEVLAERARIAREIHDILAHSLSAQIVHLEGARLLLRADRPQEALDRVERARELAKTGLEEARRAVSALREDSPPLPAALKVLAEEFRATSGADCTVTVNGAERRLEPETELAVIRTAQEALTNVRRHAPGASATVRLEFGDGSCELEVTNPPADAPGVQGGGYGLVGMRERAELLGGSLSAGEAGEVDGEGFLVRLRLPMAGRSA
ncbi:sensor histidine kinase [Sphaerisporangium sp. NPDC005289]|uniref:sensor histidine kinase n=1 Tax=Sphaerisporangium sp. NPDC005289 TaxID=3155247 RepID=UPI0033AD1DF5